MRFRALKQLIKSFIYYGFHGAKLHQEFLQFVLEIEENKNNIGMIAKRLKTQQKWIAEFSGKTKKGGK